MRKGKERERARDSARPRSPNSAESEVAHRGHKRRRSSPGVGQAGGEDEDEDESEEEPPLTPRTPAEELPTGRKKNVRFFGLAQDEEERREVKRRTRRLERTFIENRDEYLKTGNEDLVGIIEQADTIFKKVRQTADATHDSRLMVGVSDLAQRKSALLAHGDTATGIDVDEFVSKCISFMRRGAATQALSATQRRRQRDEDEDEDDEADMLDWAYLGAHACFPFNSRPAVAPFLLGPLSVQKRVRQATQRRARQRADDRAEVAPEALRSEDLAAADTNTVRHACSQIKARLSQHCAEAEERIYAAVPNPAGIPQEELDAVLRQHRLTATGGPNLFDFVINPTSFGQTVENLFYIAFLVKEGEVGIHLDDDDMPALVVNTESVTDARARKSTRHQAVFGIDYKTWQDLVAAFEIREPLIPHRDEGQGQVGPRGWYA
ncbi:hypothetical protein ANO11243_069040 [Dothideomycetidae sp. 11243]|nr:hypothetical protein ANO11243_069040 [fungal sp. No.11243]